jgi:hypothetical protein
MDTIARTTKKGVLFISLIKVVLREIRIQDFQDDYLPMETLLADFPARCKVQGAPGSRPFFGR